MPPCVLVDTFVSQLFVFLTRIPPPPQVVLTSFLPVDSSEGVICPSSYTFVCSGGHLRVFWWTPPCVSASGCVDIVFAGRVDNQARLDIADKVRHRANGRGTTVSRASALLYFCDPHVHQRPEMSFAPSLLSSFFSRFPSELL